MAKYNVPSGEIQAGYLYIVAGGKSVVYNSVTYNTDDTFLGVADEADFTFDGTGSEAVYQLLVLTGGSLEFVQNSTDIPVFDETTELKGFSVEFVQQGDDIRVFETTTIKGFALEFVDFPIYAFQIITKRL